MLAFVTALRGGGADVETARSRRWVGEKIGAVGRDGEKTQREQDAFVHGGDLASASGGQVGVVGQPAEGCIFAHSCGAWGGRHARWLLVTGVP